MPEALQRTAVVWFKRDLRLRDHAPLAEAARIGRALGLVVIEPAWLRSPECHPRHVAYLLACVARLRDDLAARGLPLIVRVAELPQALATLRAELAFTDLLSHEETGPGWSYDRDRAVADWCRHTGVRWQEHAQTGVVRRLRSRLGWAGRWTARMDAPEVPSPSAFQAALPLDASPLPTLRDLGLPMPMTPMPAAGEAAALAVLDSFLAGRGRDYRRALSSPLTAADGCSRLSEHLAFGTVSMRVAKRAFSSFSGGSSLLTAASIALAAFARAALSAVAAAR